MATGGTTMDAINASMTQWLTGEYYATCVETVLTGQ